MIADLTQITFGFEQTFTIPEWWAEPGFTHVSDTPLKREKMLQLAQALVDITGGKFIQSLDIYQHLQYETFLKNGEKSFVVTMDPGSIEVKTPPIGIDKIEDLLTPLFEAARIANIVPYRNWWYGIKGGTEGGCHINMGGSSYDKNLFIQNPYLLLKYFALLHNHPFLHYPFMGVDVGPGGNAQRMDEKKDFKKIQNRFLKAHELYKKNELDYKKLWEIFKDTSLITEKSSAPSLAKLSSPNFVIEDRAQESFRNAQEATLVAKLKLSLLQLAIEQSDEITLTHFKNELHGQMLTSFSLWENFQFFCNKIGINPVLYQLFFDRQFPLLTHGVNPPQFFKLKEGRRPRKILSEEKRNNIVVSKKVDTRYKRFEVYFVVKDGDKDEYDLLINATGIENSFKLFLHQGYLNFGEMGQAYYGYIDIKVDDKAPTIAFEFINRTQKKTLEIKTFHLLEMQWI